MYFSWLAHDLIEEPMNGGIKMNKRNEYTKLYQAKVGIKQG